MIKFRKSLTKFKIIALGTVAITANGELPENSLQKNYCVGRGWGVRAGVKHV